MSRVMSPSVLRSQHWTRHDVRHDLGALPCAAREVPHDRVCDAAGAYHSSPQVIPEGFGPGRGTHSSAATRTAVRYPGRIPQVAAPTTGSATRPGMRHGRRLSLIAAGSPGGFWPWEGHHSSAATRTAVQYPVVYPVVYPRWLPQQPDPPHDRVCDTAGAYHSSPQVIPEGFGPGRGTNPPRRRVSTTLENEAVATGWFPVTIATRTT